MSSDRPIGLAPEAELEGAGQDARKYASKNPVVRWLIARWFKHLRNAIGPCDGVVADVGTGEGIALKRLGLDSPRLVGLDYRSDKLIEARTALLSLSALRADAGMLPLRTAAIDTCLCLEVLEHLVAPHIAVAELGRVTRSRCVVSVPWEPLFRIGNLMRAKNVRRLGNDPEHVQQFTPRRLRRLLARSFDNVDVRRCFPWIIAVAESGKADVALQPHAVSRSASNST